MSKKLMLGIVWSVVVAAWLAMGIGLVIGIEGNLRLAMVTAAAVTLEVGFWVTAAILGVSVFESRKRIWHFVRGLFGKADERN